MTPEPPPLPDGGTAAPNIDRFEVRISNVRGDLRTAEPRPVFLAFDFDKGFIRRETSVYTKDCSPVWTFPSKVPSATRKAPAAPSETSFLYRTEYAHRLHRKYLVVSLSERSPNGDVVWGSGTLSLESLARGCEHVALNMIARDDVTCYGTIRFTVSMINVAEVSVLLSDLKLQDYSERFAHDVKLIYFEFGFNGFEDGYRQCTERRSDAEPRFFSRPMLKRDCKLREMVSPSPSPNGPLRVFFAVHRQVARSRTEQIGLGALPVRLLFQKVHDGWMDVPSKFKVPLQNDQGVLKGKIILRNIPRFHQLPGEDLVNVNGVITPIDVDLSQRKIVPWMKLPRSLESQLKKPPVPPAHMSKHARVSSASSSSETAALYESSTTSSTVNGYHKPHPHSPAHATQQPIIDAKSHPGEVISVVSTDPSSPKSQPQPSTIPGYDISAEIESLSLFYMDAKSAEHSRLPDAMYAHPHSAVLSESGTTTPLGRAKSGNSVGSYGLQDAGVEIGSIQTSVASDEGPRSGHTSSDWQSQPQPQWIAVEDPTNGLFYFANKVTNESLWLPPDWECESDSAGRTVFVDYGSGTRQYEFPADEARQYRSRVYGE